MSSSNLSHLPGMTYVLPDSIGKYSIEHVYVGTAINSESVFTGPLNLVLNRTSLGLFRPNSGDTLELTSINVPHGLQIIKNNGAKINNMSSKFTCNIYDITVENIEGFSLDVTDKVGTYAVKSAGVAYIAADSKVYYSVNGEITVPGAGEYTVLSAETLDEVKAAVDPNAYWNDDGKGTLTKASSGIYFVKPGATKGNGTESAPYGTLTEVVSAIKADHANGLIGDKATVKVMTHLEQKASGLWNNSYDRSYYLDYRALNSAKYAHPEVEITYTSYESNTGATDPEYIDDKRGRIAFGFSSSKHIHMLIVGPTKFENIILLDFRNDGTYSNIHMNGYDVTFGKNVDVYQTAKATVAANQDATRPDVNRVTAAEEVPSFFKKNNDGTKMYLGGSYETFNASTIAAKRSTVIFEEIPTDGLATKVATFFVGDGQHNTAAPKYVNLIGHTVYFPAGYVHFMQLFESSAAELEATVVDGPYNVVLNGTTVNTLWTPANTATAKMLPDGFQVILNGGAKININSVDDMITAPYYELTVENANGLSLDVTDTVGTYTVKGGKGVAYAVAADGKKVYYQVGTTLTVPAGVYTVSSAASVAAIKEAVNSEVTWEDNDAGILTRGATEKTFYVSNSKSSSTQNGTQANPFKDIKSAIEYVNSKFNLIAGDKVNLIVDDNYKVSPSSETWSDETKDAITAEQKEKSGKYTAWAPSGGQLPTHVYTIVVTGAYGNGENGTFLATEATVAPAYNSIYMGGPTIIKNINLMMKRHNSDTTWGTSGYDVIFENVDFYYTYEYSNSRIYSAQTEGRVGNIALCASSASAPMGSGGHVVLKNVKSVNKIMTGAAAPTYTGDLTLELNNVVNSDGQDIVITLGGYRSGQTNSAGQYYNASGDANSGINESIDPYNLAYVTTIKGDFNLILNNASAYARTWDPQWSFKYCGPVSVEGDLNIISMNGSDISKFIYPDTNVPTGADASKLNSFVVAGNKYYLSLTGEADVTISEEGVATSANGYFYTVSADGNTVRYTKTTTLTSDKICYANAAPSFAALISEDSALAAGTTAPLGQVFDSWIVDEETSTLTAKFYAKSYPTYYVKFGVTAGSDLTYKGVTGKAYPTVSEAITAINATGLYTAADAVPVIVLEDDTDLTKLSGYVAGDDVYWHYGENGTYFYNQKGDVYYTAGEKTRMTSFEPSDITPASHTWTLVVKAPDGAETKPYLAYSNLVGANSTLTITGPTVFQNIAIVANRQADRAVCTNGYDVTFDGCTFNRMNACFYSKYAFTGLVGGTSVKLQKGPESAAHNAPGGTVKFVGTTFNATDNNMHRIYPVRHTSSATDFTDTVSFVFEDSVDQMYFAWSIYDNATVTKRVGFQKGLELIADNSVVISRYNSAKDCIDVTNGVLVVMKDGGVVNPDANGDIIPAALNADKKWVIKVDDYDVRLAGDGTLTTNAPYNYYVAFVDGSYNAYIGKVNNGIISDLPSGSYELAFVNTDPATNNFAEMRTMVTNDVNKQNAGSWTQKAGTNLYIAKGFTSKYVVKHPVYRGSVLSNRVESANEAYTVNLEDTYMGNGVVSFKANADGSTIKQPNLAYDFTSGGVFALPTADGGNIPAASVRYVTIKYYYKTVEGGGKLVGQKMLGFNIGRFYNPETGKHYNLTEGNSWFGGENNASLNTYVADQWATVTVDLWQQTAYKEGSGYINVYEECVKNNPNALISCLRVRPFGQTVGNPGLAAGEEFYIADYIFTDYDPRTSFDTFYVSENGTANGNGASLATALNNFEAVYELADASGFAEVDVYVDGTVSAGSVVKNEYTGITLNVLPLNASGDTITELTAVANLNLGAITVGKLNLVNGIVTNNNATIGTLAIGNVNEAQFNQLGGSVSAITKIAGTTANKLVFFVGADSKIPAVENVTANQLSIVRAPLMKDYKKTTRFAVTATDKLGVFETYSGSEYQFGWGLIPYTCYAQYDDVIFYSNEKTGYKLTIDEPGDYQLMIVGTESNHPSPLSFRATYYFTTKTLTRDGKVWKETPTVPGEVNDFYGTKIVLFPLSPDAIAWNEDLGTGKVTAIVQENYSFDGAVYTAKKAHTVDFANFVEPIIPEGNYFKGWMSADGSYATGTKALAAGEVLTAQFAAYDLAVEKDLSVLGAQIRITNGNQDLRFVSKVSKALLAELGVTELAGDNVKFGTALLPSHYLTNNEFGIGYVDTKNNKAAKVPAKKTYNSDETSITFTAVLTQLREVNKFDDYVARAYVEYVDANGVERVIYGDSYFTSVWTIADYALKLDANGTRPLASSTKTTLTDMCAEIEAYVQAPVDGKLVRRTASASVSPEGPFETEGTGRHTDVHLASGNYADATEEQFAHGKVFYNSNYGTVIREVHITGGTAKTEVGVLTDTHYEVINYNGPDMYDPEYMFTAQTRSSWNSERIDLSTINAAKIASLGDKFIITGDIIDYTSLATLDLFKEQITDRFDNGTYIVGNHDATMTVGSTGLNSAFSADVYKQPINDYWVNDPDDLDGDGDINELYYHSEVINGVMLVSIDNGSTYKYVQQQLDRFKQDLATAKENGYTILMFQHIPLATSDPLDAQLYPTEHFGDKWSGTRNYANANTGYSTANSKYDFSYNFSQPNDAVGDEMYTLITNNSDIIRGFFTGHFHQSEYAEMLPRDKDGNVYASEKVDGKIAYYYMNGSEKVYVPTIPIFGMASTNYTDYNSNNGKPNHGTMVKIVIEPAK